MPGKSLRDSDVRHHSEGLAAYILSCHELCTCPLQVQQVMLRLLPTVAASLEMVASDRPQEALDVAAQLTAIAAGMIVDDLLPRLHKPGASADPKFRQAAAGGTVYGCEQN